MITVRQISNGYTKKAYEVLLIAYKCVALAFALNYFFLAEAGIVLNFFLNFEKNEPRFL